MVRSMTGFGRSQVGGLGYMVSCEIRGVNHRFLDVHIRTSRRYSILEEKVKEEVKQKLTRGVSRSANIENPMIRSEPLRLTKLALAYYNYLKELAEKI